MSTLTITLSESLQEFITNRIVELGLTAPEEYVEKLIREEQKKQLWNYYEKEVAKAFESGTPIPAEEFWQQVREERERRR
ncbi:MAG: hypothetical protein LBE12_01545 [Planctomycetaceae bacterium]|jgi:hypothetical protein|nr:hypothetical protein [Planctomycetaceae bacterium]